MGNVQRIIHENKIKGPKIIQMQKQCIIYLLIAPCKQIWLFSLLWDSINMVRKENKQDWLNFVESLGKFTAPQKHLLW